jgi:YcxB-like protein
MRTEFQLTVDDYVDAQRTHLRKALGKKLIVPFIFIGLSALVYVWALIHPSQQLIAQLRPMGYFTLSLAFLCAYVGSGLPYRMQFRRTPALHLPFKIDAGPEGITYTGPNGHSQTLWRGFVDFRESRKSFLMYTQRNLFFIVPKRVLGAKEISDFRNLAETHIKRS